MWCCFLSVFVFFILSIEWRERILVDIFRTHCVSEKEKLSNCSRITRFTQFSIRIDVSQLACIDINMLFYVFTYKIGTEFIGNYQMKSCIPWDLLYKQLDNILKFILETNIYFKRLNIISRYLLRNTHENKRGI